MSATKAAAQGDQWITLAQVARITGRTESVCKSLAAAGTVRTFSMAGARTVYSRADAESVAQAHTKASASA